jgi:plastocyanin
MHRWRSRAIVVLASFAVCAIASPLGVAAQVGNNAPESVTVAFGVGLNTAQAGNPANHHVVPQTILVRSGGVVNFVVSGFHQIYAYNPGTEPSDIIVPAPPPAGPGFINDYNNIYYIGINPVAPFSNPAPSPLPQGVPPLPNPNFLSPAQNRVESVTFTQPGLYLVICNVRPHFLDGMYAYVRVTG